mmetsp:Transcript_20470/g.56792  ORF Transcript_20470/g.56792 Transcript_20470/m.56792 type:complete len:792 (+) Transcript_20470:70-2445(+)
MGKRAGRRASVCWAKSDIHDAGDRFDALDAVTPAFPSKRATASLGNPTTASTTADNPNDTGETLRKFRRSNFTESTMRGIRSLQLMCRKMREGSISNGARVGLAEISEHRELRKTLWRIVYTNIVKDEDDYDLRRCLDELEDEIGGARSSFIDGCHMQQALEDVVEKLRRLIEMREECTRKAATAKELAYHAFSNTQASARLSLKSADTKVEQAEHVVKVTRTESRSQWNKARASLNKGLANLQLFLSPPCGICKELTSWTELSSTLPAICAICHIILVIREVDPDERLVAFAWSCDTCNIEDEEGASYHLCERCGKRICDVMQQRHLDWIRPETDVQDALVSAEFLLKTTKSRVARLRAKRESEQEEKKQWKRMLLEATRKRAEEDEEEVKRSADEAKGRKSIQFAPFTEICETKDLLGGRLVQDAAKCIRTSKADDGDAISDDECVLDISQRGMFEQDATTTSSSSDSDDGHVEERVVPRRSTKELRHPSIVEDMKPWVDAMGKPYVPGCANRQKAASLEAPAPSEVPPEPHPDLKLPQEPHPDPKLESSKLSGGWEPCVFLDPPPVANPRSLEQVCLERWSPTIHETPPNARRRAMLERKAAAAAEADRIAGRLAAGMFASRYVAEGSTNPGMHKLDKHVWCATVASWKRAATRAPHAGGTAATGDQGEAWAPLSPIDGLPGPIGRRPRCGDAWSRKRASTREGQFRPKVAVSSTPVPSCSLEPAHADRRSCCSPVPAVFLLPEPSNADRCSCNSPKLVPPQAQPPQYAIGGLAPRTLDEWVRKVSVK